MDSVPGPLVLRKDALFTALGRSVTGEVPGRVQLLFSTSQVRKAAMCVVKNLPTSTKLSMFERNFADLVQDKASVQRAVRVWYVTRAKREQTHARWDYILALRVKASDGHYEGFLAARTGKQYCFRSPAELVDRALM
jgi:hypothetical protein